jgi:hypothetical protein
MFSKKACAAAIATLTVGMAAAIPAGATILTPVNASGGGGGGERCLPGNICSGGSYNGDRSMVSVTEKDRGYATGSFTRVDDANDQIWTASVSNGVQVRALGRYADDNNKLGFDTGTGYNALMASALPNASIYTNHAASFFTGDGHSSDFKPIASSDWMNVTVAAGDTFVFALNDTSMGYKLSSAQSGFASPTAYANDGKDFMVTYRIPDVTSHFLIAWEDRGVARASSDWDYNDLVAEVVFAAEAPGTNAPVPEPGTMALLGSGLLAMGGMARRRKLPRE